MGCVGVRRKDLCQRLSSRRPHRRRVHALCLQPPQRSSAADFVFLHAAAGGAWPPTSTRYALLHPSGGHHCLPPQDVCGGDAPSCFFLQHSGGRMFSSLVKVDNGMSSGSIPRAPPTPSGGKRAVLRLHLFGFDGFGAASNVASRCQAKRGCPSSARATVAPCTGLPHPQCLLRHWPPQATPLRRRPGGRTRRRTPWRWRPHASSSLAWMVLSSPP
jgi:hypothetical protein